MATTGFMRIRNRCSSAPREVLGKTILGFSNEVPYLRRWKGLQHYRVWNDGVIQAGVAGMSMLLHWIFLRRWWHSWGWRLCLSDWKIMSSSSNVTLLVLLFCGAGLRVLAKRGDLFVFVSLLWFPPWSSTPLARSSKLLSSSILLRYVNWGDWRFCFCVCKYVRKKDRWKLIRDITKTSADKAAEAKKKKNIRSKLTSFMALVSELIPYGSLHSPYPMTDCMRVSLWKKDIHHNIIARDRYLDNIHNTSSTLKKREQSNT